MTADPHHPIESLIRVCRGHPTLTAVDLAALFGISPRALLECVRKGGPVPGEYLFAAEPEDIVRQNHDDPPGGAGYVFTEQGAIAAAYLLGSETATQKGIEIHRAFVRFRAAMNARGRRAAR